MGDPLGGDIQQVLFYLPTFILLIALCHCILYDATQKIVVHHRKPPMNTLYNSDINESCLEGVNRQNLKFTSASFLASFLLEAKPTFTNFPKTHHTLESSRAMSNHLGGFTSKSSKCFMSA
jgi:hypothetical protein